MEPSIDPDLPDPPEPNARRRAAPVPWRDLARQLVGFARHLGASLEEAEDIAQDALQHVAANPDWFDPERGSLATVLKTVVRNALSNRRRHRQVQQRAKPVLALVANRDASPDQALHADQASSLRRRVLGLLEPEERATFRTWLRQRSREIDARQAAKDLSMTVPAYEAAKKRLRRRLARALETLDLAPTDLFDPPEAT